jgi:hypothetical protein
MAAEGLRLLLLVKSGLDKRGAMTINVFDKSGKQLGASDIKDLGVNLNGDLWSVTLTDGSVLTMRVRGQLTLSEDPQAK